MDTFRTPLAPSASKDKEGCFIVKYYFDDDDVDLVVESNAAVRI